MNAFSDYDKWSEICKQGIFEAWVPWVSDRPLEFFIPKHDNPKEGILTDVISDKTEESQQKIITDLKRRKVVVLTSDDQCQDTYFSDVLVAKIVSIKDHHRTQDWYKNYLLNDIHPFYVHIPANGVLKESYINIAQPMTIGKKMLIKNHNMILPADRMVLVEKRFTEMIDLGVIKVSGNNQVVNE
ncbi:PemK-like protein [Paenibacillus alvei]|uniref:hypothetical protein n=1 Tax=Paenibacillus alvei TaxID=44250 RepID=UPI000289908C|nr:hypothetical protein [Paenibacillus alvei]EJW13909.1 PemK-like protein [Paenibacillus alvei DSM 29]MCY9544702.1 PemK-like protein [Paenibacillus alvei]MCY9707726.1 PemK-like protein [Paenibacillus alvei]MCY9757707.1 PemK-like protein [Paenibacillus alvei]MEC0082761.1 PemK-like protein [Paenibacillus alvei]